MPAADAMHRRRSGMLLNDITTRFARSSPLPRLLPRPPPSADRTAPTADAPGDREFKMDIIVQNPSASEKMLADIFDALSLPQMSAATVAFYASKLGHHLHDSDGMRCSGVPCGARRRCCCSSVAVRWS